MDNKRFLKVFENQNAYESQKDEVMVKPHVVLLEDTKKVIYQPKKNYDFNGHEYIDFGLPSGTLWAKYNVGATSTSASGDYFQWGNTVSKNLTNPYYDGTTFTKYNEIDGKKILDLEDDPAHVHMGGDWHTPTIEQFIELLSNVPYNFDISYSTNILKTTIHMLIEFLLNGEKVMTFYTKWSDYENKTMTSNKDSLSNMQHTHLVLFSNTLHENTNNAIGWNFGMDYGKLSNAFSDATYTMSYDAELSRLLACPVRGVIG